MKVDVFISSLVDHSCGTHFYKNSCDYANARKKYQKSSKDAFFAKKILINLH